MSIDERINKLGHTTRRLFDVLTVINAHPGIGPGPLAAQLGVSRATLMNDIATLKALGVLPAHDNRAGYYLSNHTITADERQAMMSALRLLGHDLMDVEARDLFDSLKRRWANHESETAPWSYPVDAIGHHLTMDLTTKERPQLIRRLRSAILAGEAVYLEECRNPYLTFGPQRYEVWVLQLIFHNVGWYALLQHRKGASDNGQAPYFVQRLDRLHTAVKKTGHRRALNQQLHHLKQARDLLATGWDMFVPTSASPEHRSLVRLRCKSRAAALLKELEQLPQGNKESIGARGYQHVEVSRLGHGGGIATVDLPDDEGVRNEFVRWLSTWADEIEVLEPAWLRERITERLRKTAEVYGMAIRDD